jgi:aminopeptidase N
MSGIRKEAAYLVFFVLWVTPVRGQGPFSGHEEARRSRTYDVLHYRLELGFDFQASAVHGSVGITWTPLDRPLDSLVLDAVEMKIHSVRLADGAPLAFRESSPRLVIDLNRQYAVGETLTVSVKYSCTPSKGLYFIHAFPGSVDKHNELWSQGEDMDNRYWFPCYDYPNDKATSEVIATVPDSFTLLSNGRLVEEKHDVRHRTRTFHWSQEKPHSSYLIMVAAGKYAIVRDICGKVPLMYYVPPEDLGDVTYTFGKTPSMMRFFEKWTGVPFPWEKYAQIVIDDFMWGGMENTSAVTLNTATVVDSCAALDFPSDGVIAHELAHMWWGDLVTPRDWTHLWLNEGFATYFETLFAEQDRGKDQFQYEMILAAMACRSADRTLGRKPIVSHDSYPANLYSRGAWVLHMLRQILGDDGFQRGLRFYLKRFEYSCAETEEFKLALEDATGQNLTWFFRQWVYGAGYPHLKAAATWDSASYSLQLSVEQTQQTDSLTGSFRIPLAIECTTRYGKRTRTLWIDRQHQSFSIPLEEPPLMVILDKGYHVLKELDFPRTAAEYRYQLSHAEDIADRMTAARGLGDLGYDKENCTSLAFAALHDRFYGVRESALFALGEFPPDSVRSVILVATHDPSSRVRYTAVRMLAGYRDRETVGELETLARADSSCLVTSAAMRLLAEADTAVAFDVARDLVGKKSYRNFVRLGALTALRLSRDPRSLAVAIPFTSPKYDEATRGEAIAVLGELGKDSTRARDVLRSLLRDEQPEIRSSAVHAVSQWNDPGLQDFLRSMLATEKNEKVGDALRDATKTSDGQK